MPLRHHYVIIPRDIQHYAGHMQSQIISARRDDIYAGNTMFICDADAATFATHIRCMRSVLVERDARRKTQHTSRYTLHYAHCRCRQHS